METAQGKTGADASSIPAPISHLASSVSADVCGCAEMTKAIHPETHSGPRLRKFDHLELDRSRLFSGTLSKLGLAFLDLADKLRELAHACSRALFPRIREVAGNPIESCAITGTLVFGQRLVDDRKPLHHMHVELWGRSLFGAWTFLGRGTTDWEGRFHIPYDLRIARKILMRRIQVEIYHTGSHRFVKDKSTGEYKAEDACTLFQTVEVDRKSLVGLTYDIGLQQLRYWEYRPDSAIPRVLIPEHGKDAPEAYSQGRLDAIERQFVPIELIKVKHLLALRTEKRVREQEEKVARMEARLGSDAVHSAEGAVAVAAVLEERSPQSPLPGGRPGSPELTLEKIQADYPENLTQCLELRHPGFTRSDKWFGERFMNGMYASDLDSDPDNPDRLWVHYHWNTYDTTPGEHAIPDVDIYFEMGDDGLPLPVEICLTGPLNAHELDERPVRTFTPDDGDRWLQAKRVARVSGALYTEVVHHFTVTHLNTEQFSIAARRSLRLSPLTVLLFPHLKEVTLVDSTADRILIGPGYISRATALTAKGIEQVAFNTLGTLDWKNWQPPEPLSEAHTYARASQLYWQVLQEYVAGFLERNRDGIEENWFEVFRFSEDLVHHSVPMFLCKYLQKALLDTHGKPLDPELVTWYRRANRMDLTADRPVVNGIPRAVSRITEHRRHEDADEQDWNHLRDACCYVIFQATFEHTWANSKQYDDIGEVLYACLGLRYGDGPDGVLAPESDLRIAPSLEHCTQMMWWSNMLSRTSYGFIMANEDGDISPDLLAGLEARRAEFDALGLSIDDIQSRINI